MLYSIYLFALIYNLHSVQAPWPGLEPGTYALTAHRSTIELPRNVSSNRVRRQKKRPST